MIDVLWWYMYVVLFMTILNYEPHSLAKQGREIMDLVVNPSVYLSFNTLTP